MGVSVRTSVRPLHFRVPFSYPQLLLHHWIKFNETFTDSLLYSPIVHLLFHILIRKIFGVSSSKTWTLSFLNTGVPISYPQLLLHYWTKFNGTLTESLLYNPIVHLLFYNWVGKYFGFPIAKHGLWLYLTIERNYMGYHFVSSLLTVFIFHFSIRTLLQILENQNNNQIFIWDLEIHTIKGHKLFWF